MSSGKRWAAIATFAVALVLVCMLPAGAFATDRPNSECAACHGESSMVSNAFFDVGAVNKATACRKCHLDSLVGAHPLHYGGGNCGTVCHSYYGSPFGASLISAVPTALTAEGSFASTTSPDVSSVTLHTIHARPRWIAEVWSANSKCASCHAAAACTACHNGSPSPDTTTHSLHGSTAGGYDASSTVIAPWVGDLSPGVVASQSESTVIRDATLTCMAVGCHSAQISLETSPGLMDSYTHPALKGGYLPTTVTKVGTWREMSGPSYTMSREAYTNYVTSTLSVTFTGQRVALISDRDPYRGFMEISIDSSVVAIVDQYNVTTQYQRTVWVSPDLAPGSHTITVRPTGGKSPSSRGAWISFDQLQVYTVAVDTIAPDCVSCHDAENAPSHGGTAAAHDLDIAGSTYDNGTQTGCVDSDAGCHGGAVTSYASSQYHPDNACTAGACHTASNHSDAAFDNPNSCIDCHNGAYVNAANVIQGSTWMEGHYNETTHTVAGLSTAVSAGGTYSATCADCHNPVNASGIDGLYNQHQGLTFYGSTTCYDCHNAGAAIQAIVTDGTRTDACAACHTSAVMPAMVQHASTATTVTGTEAQGAGTCKTVGCHASTNLHALHKSNTNATPNGCMMTGCHDATKQGVKPTAKSCGVGGTCHNSGTVHPNEAASHTTLASAACTVCHGSGDLKLAHGDICDTCHGNPSYPALPVGKLECVSCHNGADVGLHVYDPTDPNHYSETTHTASPFTLAAQGTGADGAVPTEGEQCSLCHTSTLKVAHSNTSTSGGAVTCSECHLDVTLNSAAQVAGNWASDRCTDCHDYGTARTHDGMATVHVVAAGTCASTGTSCHNFTDLAKMHDVSQSGGTRNYAGCENTGCHVTNDARPAIWATPSCGEGTTGCHQDKTTTNHGGGHSFDTTASVYNNVTQTGCTDSGAGCHGAAPTTYASTAIHPNAGCTSGPCHTAANHNNAQFDDPNSCQNCHGGGALLYDNASDTVALTDIAPNGHYSETTHTASGMGATVSSGGTYSAACSDCHNPVGAGIDGFYNQHQGLGGGLGATTCSDCHNKNAAIQTIVTDAVRNNACNACHTAGALPTMVQHATTAPVVAGTESAGAGSCATTGCHATTDLHALHKSNDSTAAANGCAMTNCHDYTQQGVKPTTKTCGTGGACHNSSPIHPTEAAKHTTLASAQCVVCHELGGDLKLTHGNLCAKCHGNATYPALPTGKLECTSCHNGVDVGLHVYDPYDPEHYMTEMHVASGTDTGIANTGGKTCNICHMLEMKPEHMEKATSAFPTVPGTHESKCVACHELKVDDFTVEWTGECLDCHAVASVHGDASTKHDFTTGNAACAGSNCHDTSNVMTMHDSALPGNGDCMNCHDGNWMVPDKRLCSDCHAAHPAQAGVHASTTTACTVCHTSKIDVATGHTSCATCHEDPRLADYLQNNYTPTCTDCHVSGVIGAKAYLPADPNHATGNEVTHTASPFTLAAQGTGADGAVPVKGEECSLCHSATLKTAHSTISTNGGSVTCIECHTDTVLGSSATVDADWSNDRCTDCHDYGAARTHDAMATIHVVAAGTCAGTGTSCHDYTDLADIHDVSQSGGARTYAGCENTGCHTVDNVRPAIWATPSCGSGTTGCHQDKTAVNHGGKHLLNLVGSNYNNAAQAGCTNSGAGCHGTSAGTDITDYHPASGCTTGLCHTSVDKPTHHEPFVCGDCHDSTYVGAADTTALADPNATGHYNETTHTASGMTNTVSAGGSYTATCATCHNPVSAGVDGLYNQHQGLETLGATTCSDCHNKNAAISALITDAVRTDTCAACHTASVLPTMVQHGATAPSVVGTEAAGAGSCQTTGCHATLDLHALHANNNSGNANGCAMTGCHDSTKQGAKPTAKSCGAGGTCHNINPIHPSEGAKHTTMASGACVVCHETTDLKLVHADNCGTCHGNATYPTLPVGKLECVSCHDGSLVGTHVYDPADPNHYMVVNHTADGVEAGISNTGGWACETCHSLEMKPEHVKSSTATTTLLGYADICIGCHEVKVDSIGTWTKDCQECHATATVHTSYSTRHDFTTGNSACAGATCHDITDVTIIHADTNPGSADCTVCHDDNLSVPTVKLCSGCHLDHPAMGTVHASATTECTACHTTKTDVASGHASCATCHSSAKLTDYLQNNYTGACTDCHNALVLGTHAYSPAVTNHYSVTTHTASPFTLAYQGTGVDGAVVTEGEECSGCHTASLSVAHATTSLGAPVNCVQCHTDSTLGSAAQVSGNWTNNRCTDCHDYSAAKTHDEMGTIHVVSTARGCAGSGTNCHNGTDLAKLHDVSQSGGTRNYQGCSSSNTTGTADAYTCHVTDDTRPVSISTDSCGSGSAGCHQEKTVDNHGKLHDLNLTASNYNNASQAGCTNSGAGCHGTSVSLDIGTYHATTECENSACHLSASKPTHNEPFVCGDCHDGTYVGAKDTTALADANAAGHYNETTHTATGMSNTVGAGGTYSAACSDCHNPVNGTSIDGLYNQHQGLGGGLGSTTCSDCHNANAGVQAIVTDATRTNTCVACHTVGVLPTMVQHGSTVGSAAGTETVAGACVSGGCHTTTDLHALHKSNVGTAGANGCTMAGCHDVTKQGVKPTAKSCGTGGACHNAGSPHPGDAAKHTTMASGACVACHESTDLKLVHAGGGCQTCHGNATYPALPYGKLECISCHNGIDVGLHVYDPADPNHYVDASHLSAGNGTYNTYACTQCHKMDMKSEHSKTSVAFVTGSYAGTTTVIGKCIGCHELKVDAFGAAWDDKCASCHPSTHTERATKHNASATNPTCGGVGCHDITDVAVIHNESITTNSLHPSCVTCHLNSDSVPLPIECMSSGCHAGMRHGHSLDLTNSNYNNTTVVGCTNSGIGCHGSMPTSPTPDYAVVQYHRSVATTATGCETGACHTSASQDDTAFNNPNTCQNCHGGRAVAPLNYTNALDVSPLASPTTSATGGHYNETSHMIVTDVATMSVGGASSATCVTCHQGTNPNGLDGEWFQHQVLQGYGNTTCYDCHSFVTPGDVAGTSRIGSLIQTSVANARHLDCVDCHNVLTMGVSYVMHETTSSPPATATVLSTPEFQCGDVGCHYDESVSVQLEIHELHKGDGKIVPYQRWTGSEYTTYTVDRCAQAACHPNYVASGDPLVLSGSPLPTGTGTCEKRPEPQCVDCHDPLKQGWKPTEKSCGANGDCHITSPHSQMGPAHSVTALSQACVDCHETTDLRGNHGYANDETCGTAGSDNVCHNLEGTTYWYNSTEYTFTLAGKKECADCHALGKMPNVTRDHAPHDPNHYVGSETTHTAISQTGSFGAIYSVIATSGFDGSWPASWTTVGAVTVQNTTPVPYEGTHYAEIANAGSFSRVFDTAGVSSPTVEFYYQAAALDAGENGFFSYSTNGSTWTTVSVLSNQAAWTKVGPVVVPRSETLTIRFSSSANAANEYFDVDAFVLKPSDAAGAGCFVACHYQELKPEHFKASSDATRVPGIYPDKCVDCHENRTDSFDTSTTAIDWDRTCVECHGTSKHLGQTAKHDATLVSPTCGGSGCHFLKDVAVIHNNSSLTNTWPVDPAQTCTVCHDDPESTPSTLNCTSAGCHFGMTPHEHELDYDGSLFNTATVTGCVQSGAGCHGNSTSTNYATGYHAGSGCMTGNCHNASATNHFDPQFNDPNTCQNCHGGGMSLYAGATDRLPVDGATPNGHYPEATHTAGVTSKTTSISAGGTITARCNQCHNDVSATYVDGLYAQHQDVNGTVVDVSCPACHNYNAGVSAVITSDWATDACTDCHNATNLPTKVKHANTAPAVTATEYNAGVVTPGYCSAAGCHNTSDLHALHKGSASTPETRTALGCAFTGCHDYSKQGAKPTIKSCGAGGSCHTSLPTHPNEVVSHTTVVSGACVVCHESADLKVVHGDQCGLCHGNATYPTLPFGKLECVSCHVSGVVGTKTYAPTDPNHYTGTETTHTASSQTGTVSGYNCVTCHDMQMKVEHITKTTSTFTAVPATYSDKCIACHESDVDAIGTWTKTCDECHATKHDSMAAKHDATAFAASTCEGAGGATETVTLHSESFDSVTAPTWVSTWTRGGTNSTLYVTSSTTASSSPNSAKFASDAASAKSAYFEKSFNTAALANPKLKFGYSTSFAPATATNVTLRPTGTSTSAWPTLVGGATAELTVDEATSDGDTSYVACNAANQNVVFTMPDTAIDGTINSVTAYATHRIPAADNDAFRWIYNNGSGETVDGVNVVPGTAYAETSFSIPAPTGGWNQTAVNALSVGMRTVRISNPMALIRLTQVYVVVNYTPNASPANNYLKADYSTNGGGSWSPILAPVSTTTGWTQVTADLPQAADVLVRFSSASDATNRITYVDGIDVTYDQATSGCHVTSDVSAIHNNSVSSVTTADTTKCTTCHTNNTAVPTKLACNSTGCHVGTHTADHLAVASGACLTCHNTGNNIQTVHAGLGDGCNVCHGGGGYTDIHVGKSPECATNCHSAESPPNPNHYTGTETSHTAGATQSGDTLDAFSLNAACGTCHDMTILSEHNAVTASKTTSPTAVCENCHLSTVLTNSPTIVSTNWPNRTTTTACISCHAADTKTNLHGSTNLTTKHAVTDASQNCGSSGAGCHPTANVAQVGTPSTTANVHTTCASCHGTASRAHLSLGAVAFASGCASNATYCHAAASYASSANHATDTHTTLTGNEAIHTATTGMTTDMDTYLYGDTCSDCHSAGLANAHKEASTTANLGTARTGWNATAQSICRDCHNAAATTNYADSGTIVKGSWSAKSCAACHTRATNVHNNYNATVHTATTSGCTLSTGCHGYVASQSMDIRTLHDKVSSGCSANGTDGKAWSGRCHQLDTPMTGTTMTCGDTGACHNNHTAINHGPDHNYTAASNYTQTVDTIGSEAGCTNSGTGCHDSAATGDTVTTFHSAVSAGCTTSDACHSDPQFADGTWRTGTTADCSRCHGGATDPGIGSDNAPLFEAASAGHYDETLHTATAGLGNVSAGGSATAACAVCHDTGLRNAHGAAGGGFSSGTKGVYVTCQECHAYNANVTSEVKTLSWQNNNCADCHNATDMATSVMHNATTAPVTNGTSTAGCGASGIGCHQTYDLHALHKDEGCTLTGCHAKNKDMTSAVRTCGQVGDCHNSTNYTTTKHQGSRGLINGADTTHTAGATQMNATVSSTACSVCHAAPLGTEHARTTSMLTGVGATYCLKCHNDSATVANIVNTSWPTKNMTTACSVCHDGTAAQTLHGSIATSHTATSVTGCTAVGAGCHGTVATPDIPTVHNNKCAISGCHSTTTIATQKACNGTGCHATGYSTATYVHNTTNGDDTTHTITPAAAAVTVGYNTGTATAACSVCHSTTLKSAHNSAAGYATNSLGGVWLTANTGTCVGCHNATTPISVPTMISGGTFTDTCVSGGCHNTTQQAHVDGGTDAPAVTGSEAAGVGTCNKTGCHGSVELHELHKNATTCAATACHDAANKDKRPTAKTCGTGGTCHVGYETGAHAVSSGGSACSTCHSGKTGMVNDTTSFHHVLDGTAYRAPGSGTTYPTSTSALECVSCHTDHNYFNAAKGSNLRQAIGTQGSSYTNTDFLTSGTYGICVSCHSVAQTKNTTGQKVIAGRPTATRIISGVNYNTSKHNYVINDATKIGFAGPSAFQANCVKCHDDEQDTDSKMTSTYKIGLHTSAEASLLKALGVTLVGTNYAEEGMCYKCHTGATAGTDGYGVNPGGTAMTARARGVQAAFSGAYGHEPSTYVNIHKENEYDGAPTSIIGETVSSAGWWGTGNTNKHVECEDCHNVHEAKAGTYTFTNNDASPRANNVPPAISAANSGWGVTISGPGVASSGGNWAGSGTAGSGVPKYPTYAKTATTAFEWQLCLKCHSRYAWGNVAAPTVPSLGVNGTTAVMTDVGRDFDPANYSYHPLFAIGRNQPAPTLYAAWNSNADRRALNGGTGNGLSNTFVDGWLATSRVTCQDCHSGATWGAAEGAHGSSNKWMIRSVNTGVKTTKFGGGVVTNAAAAANSYCINCHRIDVYGDANGVGVVKATAGLLSRTNHGSGFTSCMSSTKVPNQVNGCNNCHGGRPDAAGTTTIENGFIHGSSAPAGASGGALGQRFCNGASWDAHQFGRTGDGGAVIGCSTINATDGYSSCNQHDTIWEKTTAANYDY